jgi:hypothetical protein
MKCDGGWFGRPYREAAMLRAYLVFLFLMVVSGCTGDNPPAGEGHRPPARAGIPASVADSDGSGIEFDLYEPAVRYLMKPLETQAAPKQWVVFVTLPYGLSEESFCERFAGNAIPVRAFAEYDRRSAEESAYIIHICNPTLAKVSWEGPDQACILVSYHAASGAFCGCDAPSPITVRREMGKWMVVQDAAGGHAW